MRNWAVVVVLLAALVTSCSEAAPTVPADAAAVASELSGPDASSFLSRISTHPWPDGGVQAGESLQWIAADAGSSDPAAAERAGRSAHAIAAFLSGNADDLTTIGHGLLGIRKSSLGELNPGMAAAYAGALTPYQAAFVGDATGTRGFTPFEDRGYADARGAIDVLFTAEESGQAFADSSYATVMQMLTAAARAGCTDPTAAAAQGPLIGQAGALAGVIHAAAAKPHAAQLTVQEYSEVANQGLAAMAAACDKVGDDVPDYLIPYVDNGTIKTPEQAQARPGDPGSANYHTALKSYLSMVKKFDWSQFDERYDIAAGVQDPNHS